MARAVGRGRITVQARLRYQDNLCVVYGVQSDTRTDVFFFITQLTPIIVIPSLIHSYI